MGSKGAALLFYLSLACLFLGAVLSSRVFVFSCIFFVSWTVFELAKVYLFLKRHEAEKLVLFLPVYRWWAKLLLLLYRADRKLCQKKFKKPYEIHVVGNRFSFALLAKELEEEEEKGAGNLYLFDTFFPPPSSFRKKIRLKSRKGEAYLGKPLSRALLLFLSLGQPEILKAVLLKKRSLYCGAYFCAQNKKKKRGAVAR